MSAKIQRHPLKHFFIMDRVQKSFISKILGVFSTVSLLTLLSVAVVYYLKYRTGYFYYMTEDMNADLIRHSIWGLILPSAVPSLLASLVLGAYFSLYASRKIALPLYKIRQWATSLFAGDLDYQISLRKGDDLFELETSCKQVSKRYHEIFCDIKDLSENPETSDSQKVEEIREFLSRFKSI